MTKDRWEKGERLRAVERYCEVLEGKHEINVGKFDSAHKEDLYLLF